MTVKDFKTSLTLSYSNSLAVKPAQGGYSWLSHILLFIYVCTDAGWSAGSECLSNTDVRISLCCSACFNSVMWKVNTNTKIRLS